MGSVYLCARFVPAKRSISFVSYLHGVLFTYTHTHIQSENHTHSSHTTGIFLFPARAPTYQRGLSWHKRIIKIPNYFFKYANDTALSLSLLHSLFASSVTCITSLRGWGRQRSAIKQIVTLSRHVLRFLLSLYHCHTCAIRQQQQRQ